MRRRPTIRRPALLPLLVATLLGPLVGAGCSGSGEDVRVTFCKNVILTRVADPGAVVLTRLTTNPRGYAGLTVAVGFDDDDRARHATCNYRYNAVDDTAELLANPLSAYATSPTAVVIDGEALSRAALAEAVKAAVVRQGRAAVERARAAISG